MAAMRTEIARFLREQGGATAVEYGLVAALVAVAAILAITLTGDGTRGLFTAVEERATTVFEEADT
jgi:pilus assembly protein Flp/PilA